MSSIADLRPGDIGFGPLNTKSVKLLVDAGQLLLGEGFTIGKLRIEHVFVVTLAGQGLRTRAVEAMPSGAREYSIDERWTPEYAYVRIPEDYAGQSQDAAAIARAMIGTPYSFASYFALAAWRFGRKPPRAQGPGMAKLERWIDRRRPSQSMGDGTGMWRALPAEAICSVLADQAWSLTGKKIMHDVAHQCVTPGALARTLLEMPGAEWFWPGRD